MHMSKNILEQLFESKTRVRILKFLFRNADTDFTSKDLITRVQEPRSMVNREIQKFLEIGLLKVKR